MSNKVKATDMKKDGKLAWVPKLRFPEFRGAEGWKALPLDQLAKRGKQKNRDEKIVRVLTNSAEFGVMDQRDYFDKDIATQGKLDGYFVVELGDYVYNPRISTTAPVGPISKNNIATGVMSPLYTVFRFKDRNNDFYAHYFKTTGWHTYMRQASSTGARHDRMAISSDDFIAMPMPVASPEEQQKIAECLSSVDELIVTQTRKLDALKTHKKGLMQQLFPREGETRPRLRFPEFKNAGDWETTILGKLIGLQSGFAFSSDYFGSGGKKLVTPKNFTKFGFGNFDSTISKYSTEEVPPKFICSPGDLLLLLTDLTPTCELLGKPLEVAEKDGVVLLNQRIAKVEPISNGVTKPFLKQFFLTDTYNAVIVKTASGSTVKHSSNKIILNMGIVLPAPEEQQRIADCLTSIDDLIAAQTQKLAALKTHKKGLMQQLFPSSEEAEA